MWSAPSHWSTSIIVFYVIQDTLTTLTFLWKVALVLNFKYPQFCNHWQVPLKGLVVTVLAIGPKVRGFKPSREQRIFKGDKIRRMTSFGGEIKPSAPCRKILQHVTDPCGVWQIYLASIINENFSPRFYLLHYKAFLLVFSRELWWINQIRTQMQPQCMGCFVRYHLITVTSNHCEPDLHSKITAFLDIALCSLVKVDWCFRGAYCLHHRPDDGGSTHLRNFGILQRDYRALYTRKVWPSYSPPWEPETLISTTRQLALCIWNEGASYNSRMNICSNWPLLYYLLPRGSSDCFKWLQGNETALGINRSL
jgi:hypothetical protein